MFQLSGFRDIFQGPYIKPQTLNPEPQDKGPPLAISPDSTRNSQPRADVKKTEARF